MMYKQAKNAKNMNNFWINNEIQKKDEFNFKKYNFNWKNKCNFNFNFKQSEKKIGENAKSIILHCSFFHLQVKRKNSTSTTRFFF